MIPKGLFRKSIQETLGFTLLFGLGLLGFHCLLSSIAPTIFKELSENILKFTFFKTIIKGLFGDDAGQTLGTTAIVSLSWIHPIPLILLWTQSIVFWSRIPAAEIENGTMDILLSQPVSRFRILGTETLIWLGEGIFLVLAALCGNLLGSEFIAMDHRLPMISRFILAVNLYGLFLVVGGVACLSSALCSRRGASMGYTFAFIAFSYLLSTLVPFWSPIKTISFLSFMEYYKPVIIVQNASWPFSHLSILLAIGTVFWLAGTVVFTRRNLPTS